jgi:hypothetical protein
MRGVALVAAFGIAAAAGEGVPSASAITGVAPKGGHYQGTIGPGSTAPISFTVRNGQVRDSTGTAPTASTCKRKVLGYALPTESGTIDNGHFTMSESSYLKARVTIRGTFVTPTKAVGSVSVRFRHSRGCDARTRFVAKHSTNTG